MAVSQHYCKLNITRKKGKLIYSQWELSQLAIFDEFSEV